MDSEKTVLNHEQNVSNNETTDLNINANNKAQQNSANNDKLNNKDPHDNQENNQGLDKTKKKTAFGAAGAAATGAAAGILMGSIHATAAPGEVFSGVIPEEEGVNDSAWIDDNIKLATSVNDEMSFNQAFAAARAEVGPGGAFVWRGQVKNTFYAEEWAAMSDEEKAEFNSAFHWDDKPLPESALDDESAPADDDLVAEESGENSDNDLINAEVDENGEIAIDQESELASLEIDETNDIEILGVEDDLQAMISDDQEIHLIDIADNNDIDYMTTLPDVDDINLLADNSLPGDEPFEDYSSDYDLV